MKKLIAILMLTLLSVFAFAGDGINDFKTSVGSSYVPAELDRIHVLDVSTIGTAKGQEYVTLDNLLYLTVDVDSNMVVADVSAATQSISFLSGQLFQVIGLYQDGTWSSGDYIEFNSADSNGTTIDTVTVGGLSAAGFRLSTFNLFATQDTTLYLNMKDTVSGTAAYLKYTIR